MKRIWLEQLLKFPEGIYNREGLKREDEAEGAGAVQLPRGRNQIRFRLGRTDIHIVEVY